MNKEEFITAWNQTVDKKKIVYLFEAGAIYATSYTINPESVNLWIGDVLVAIGIGFDIIRRIG